MTDSLQPFRTRGVGDGLGGCDTGNRDHLADFPLSGLGFKGCILTVGGEGGALWGGGSEKR